MDEDRTDEGADEGADDATEPQGEASAVGESPNAEVVDEDTAEGAEDPAEDTADDVGQDDGDVIETGVDGTDPAGPPAPTAAGEAEASEASEDERQEPHEEPAAAAYRDEQPLTSEAPEPASSEAGADRPRGGIPAPLAVPLRVGAVVLAGLVVGLASFLAWTTIGDDDAGDAAVSTGGASLTQVDQPVDASPSTQPKPEASARLERCLQSAQSLAASLDAARPAMKQWSVHVGAMNQLVVGEITLQQASDFWDRTRLGAMRRVTGFREAMTELRRQGVECPRPQFLTAGGRTLPACARLVEEETRALQQAQTSINTWDVHVRDMDRLRLGQLSPEDATRMWLEMWQQGVRELEGYRRAAKVARRVTGCPAAHQH